MTTTLLVENLSNTSSIYDAPILIGNHGGRLLIGTNYEDKNFSFNKSKLWSSDGTADGTILLAEYQNFVYPPFHKTAGGVIFFIHNEKGRLPWISDGTAMGTRPFLPDWWNKPVHSSMTDGNNLFFLSNDKYVDGTPITNEMWMSDGSNDGTIMFMQSNRESGTNGEKWGYLPSYKFDAAIKKNNKSSMIARVDNSKLIVVDESGKTETIFSLSDDQARPGEFRNILHPGIVFNGNYYFTVQGYQEGTRLYSYSFNTNPGLTSLLLQFPGDLYLPNWEAVKFDLNKSFVLGTKLYFFVDRSLLLGAKPGIALDGTGSNAPSSILWESDGTIIGTKPVSSTLDLHSKYLHPDYLKTSTIFAPEGFAKVGNTVYFSANYYDPDAKTYIKSLYSFTAAGGVSRIEGSESSFIGNVVSYEGRIFYTADIDYYASKNNSVNSASGLRYGNNLWMLDDSGKPIVLTDQSDARFTHNASTAPNLESIASTGDRLIFIHYTSALGYEPWSLDLSDIKAQNKLRAQALDLRQSASSRNIVSSWLVESNAEQNGVSVDMDESRYLNISSSSWGEVIRVNRIAAASDNGDFLDGKQKDPASREVEGSLLIGGKGNDKIQAKAGWDIAEGGEGNDLVKTGNGRDILTGGPGGDELWGGFGWNTFKGDRDGSEDLLVIKSDEWLVNPLIGKSGNNSDGSKCDIIEELDPIDKIIIQGVETSELLFSSNTSAKGLSGIGIYANGSLEALYTGGDLTVAQLTAMTTGDLVGQGGPYWDWG